MTTATQRERLGARIRRRRRALGLTVVEAARLADINRGTWEAAEDGSRQTRDHNFAAIEQALQWEHGSIEAVLDGDEPVPLADAAGPPAPQPRPLDEPHRDPATGELYTDPDEQELWGLALSEADRRELIYHLRARRAARDAEQRQRRAG